MKYFLPELRQKISQTVADSLKVDPKMIVVTDASDKFDADLAVPCFAIARQRGVDTQELASEAAGGLKLDELEKVEAISGFVNIWLKPQVIARALVEDNQHIDEYGCDNDGDGQTVIVDFIGLNLSKPFSVGHLRPTVQGWALIQLYKALGFEVVGDSHLGDWGTPFGMWVVGFEEWGSEEALRKDGAYELGRLYVKFREAAKDNEELVERAKAWLKKLEQGDEQALEYRQRFYTISMAHAEAVLNRLDVYADENLGESFYVESAQKLVDELIAEGVAKRQHDGSVIVRLDDFGLDTPLLLRKSDGSVLYATTDLEAIRYRKQRWNPVKMIYSVGAEQQFHFKQVFAAAEKLGYGENTDFVHAWFGTVDEMIDGKRGKMSSRKNTALLEQLLDKAEATAREMVGDKSMSDEDIRRIAVGAIKFNDFATPRKTNILFDWDKMFALQGYSSVYIQYAAVRAGSILQDLPVVNSLGELDYEWREERDLLAQLSRYPEVIKEAAAEYEPNKIAAYVYELARTWNRYYETTNVSDTEGEVLAARTWLLQLLQKNFVHALSILGIEVPSKM